MAGYQLSTREVAIYENNLRFRVNNEIKSVSCTGRALPKLIICRSLQKSVEEPEEATEEETDNDEEEESKVECSALSSWVGLDLIANISPTNRSRRGSNRLRRKRHPRKTRPKMRRRRRK